MPNHKIVIKINGKEVDTLEDILPKIPENTGLRILFIGKAPSPESVSIGHYFQGKSGKTFWNKPPGCNECNYGN